jgi:hypothetical protein
MPKTTLGCLLLVPCLAGMLQGAATLTGPVAGYVVAPSGRQLRAVLGVPGSFRFSDPIALPPEVSKIHLAPARDFALVEREGAGMGILPLSPDSEAVIAVEGAAAAADWVAFSPSARWAILFSSATNRLQVWSGLPDAPQVSLDLDAAALPEQPLLGAISDDGALAAVASRQNVFLLPGGAAPRLLLSVADVASLAILRNGALTVADRQTGSIHLLRNAASAGAAEVLASGLTGLESLYPSSDGNAVYAARPLANMVSLVDLSSGGVSDFETAASPVSLFPMRNRDTFLISAQPQQPGWVFYREGGGGRVVFVPALQEPENPQRGRRRQ